MDAIGQKLKGLMCLPSPYFERSVVLFGLYVIAGFIYLAGKGAGVFEAFFLTLGFGVIATALIIALVNAGRSLKHFEEDGISDKPLLWRTLFRPVKLGGSDPDSPNSGGNSSSGVEDEEFKRRMHANQRDSRKRAWLRMWDKVLNMGFIVAVSSLLFWFFGEGLYGFFSALFGSVGGASVGGVGIGGAEAVAFSKPRELFIFSWQVLVIMWWLAIVFLPRWAIVLMLISMSVMRVVLLVFGAMSSMWIMNIGMLPIFYGVMMVFLFGSILYPFTQLIKSYRPGDATWGVPKGSVRGQPEARAVVDTEFAKFIAYIKGESKQRPTRGIRLVGPPGTGKTLIGKEKATEENLPFIFFDGSALKGVPLIDLFFKFFIQRKTNAFADEYGGAICFIDEAEELFKIREGMSGGGGPGGINDVWDLLPYDSMGVTSNCGLSYDFAQARDRFWQLKGTLSLGKEPKTYTHKFFFPVGMGGGGGAIFPFLTWLDGTGSPDFSDVFKRNLVNNFLDGLLLFPPFNPFTKKIWRLGPAKVKTRNIMFMIATNRPWMLDPAIIREGRIGKLARFVTPGLEARKDIINLYATKAVEAGLLRPELLEEKAVEEFARAIDGRSPAEIEAIINMSYDVRATHVTNLKRIKAQIDGGVKLKDLFEQDRKYWLRHKNEVKKEGWDDERADMWSLLEARNAQIYGKADPGRTTEEHRELTAMHEYWGHFLILRATLSDTMRPSVISVMPRGNALGMVSHIPVEERDAMFQKFYVGLLRINMGSIVAERFFYGEHQPGVSSDLENATRIACFMVNRSMEPYACTEEERKKFIEIGKKRIVISDNPAVLLNPFAQDFVDKVLSNEASYEQVALILGQAFVHDYRIIRANAAANYKFHKKAVSELLRLEELAGLRLEQLCKRLDRVIVTADKLTEEQRSWWPDKITNLEDPFCNPELKPEADEVLAR